jgi:N-acetylglucosamine-6-phosphate deacetylase
MDLSIKDALRMATLTPAGIIGMNDRIGSLEKGKNADILIIDEDVNIHKTIIQGEIEYTR